MSNVSSSDWEQRYLALEQRYLVLEERCLTAEKRIAALEEENRELREKLQTNSSNSSKRQQAKNALEYLGSVFQAHIRASPSPSIL